MFLIFRECQPRIVLSLFLTFCEIWASCSYKIVLIVLMFLCSYSSVVDWVGFRVQIKCYKVILKNCKGCWAAPTMVGWDLLRFWNVHSPKSSKTVFLEVLCIKWTQQLEYMWTHWRSLKMSKKFCYIVNLVKA